VFHKFSVNLSRVSTQQPPPCDPVRMDPVSYSFPAFIRTPGSVWPELSVIPAPRLNPHAKRFRTDPHPQTLWELMEQAAKYFSRWPTLAGVGKNLVSQRVKIYPEGLVGSSLCRGVSQSRHCWTKSHPGEVSIRKRNPSLGMRFEQPPPWKLGHIRLEFAKS